VFILKELITNEASFAENVDVDPADERVVKMASLAQSV
jgi:hypothetical protein